jgi:hypothetical protein
MQTAQGRLAAMVRATALVAVALALATPAWAQFGGLKKKVKQATSTQAASPAAAAAGATGPAPVDATGGTVVLTDDVVAQLIEGMNAASAEREAAKNADTPYGRYNTASAAYKTAQQKCSAAQGSFGSRMASDEKASAKYGDLVEKMTSAQTKGDTTRVRIYSDSAMTMIDPACAAKEPKQPDSYYEDQRKADSQAEDAGIKKSKLSRSDYAQGMERVNMALRDVPGDLSKSEKDAVAKRSDELKKLLGYEVPAARTEKAAPAPAPAPAPAAPAMTKEQSDMSACMAENSKKNEKQIIALGERMKAAQEAGDMNAVMAMADTLARLQSGNCRGK